MQLGSLLAVEAREAGEEEDREVVLGRGRGWGRRRADRDPRAAGVSWAGRRVGIAEDASRRGIRLWRLRRDPGTGPECARLCSESLNCVELWRHLVLTCAQRLPVAA